MSAPYRNNDGVVIQRLAETLQNVPPERREQMIAEAKNRIMSVQKLCEIEREALWNYQLNVLCEKRVPELVGMPEDEFLDYCEPLKAKFLLADGKLDCLVLPPTFLTPAQKMTLVIVDGQRGRSYLNPALVRPVDGATKRPDGPYLMLDVEDGRAMLGISSDECAKRFVKNGRFGCTVDEGEMVAIYWPSTLKHHYIDCPVSRYDRDSVPCVGIWYGEPKLDAHHSGSAHSRYGSASCGSIFVP